MNHLANRYSIMRHGQSEANVRGIIVSSIDTDRHGDYGLTERGRQQVLAAAQSSGLPRQTVICSSDFSRASQSAEIVRACLRARPVAITEALRERCFGDWEGTSTANYAHVWTADEAGHSDGGVEPANAVRDRATAFIAELEQRYEGRDILLVSHGDTLQILQTAFGGIDPSRHRSVPHLETAEIRLMRDGG